MKNYILGLIQFKIKQAERIISNAEPTINIEVLEGYISLIENNNTLEDLDFLKQFNLEELKSILPSELEKDLANLSFYIRILNSSYKRELINQKDVIKDVLIKIHSNLKSIVEKAIVRSNMLELAKARYEQLKNIYNKINTETYDLTSMEMEIIYEYLKELKDQNKAIDVLAFIGEKVLARKEYEPEEETQTNNIEETVEEEELTENEDVEKIEESLRRLFRNYGLELDLLMKKLSDKEKTDFIKYVKVNRVEEILEVLESHNISLNDKYNGKSLLLFKSKQIRTLLMYSNGRVLDRVLNFVKKEGIVKAGIVDQYGTVKEGIDFDLLIEVPARFIERKARYKSKNDKADLRTNDTFGASSYFVENLIFFKTLGVSPERFCQVGTLSILPPGKIEDTINIFKLYGITQEEYTKRLSCFNSIRQAEALDMFIELGLFDYVVKNMSNCQLLPDSPIFYRMLYCLKYTDYDIFNEAGELKSSIRGKQIKSDNPPFDVTKTHLMGDVHQDKIFYGRKSLYDAYEQRVKPLLSDTSLALTREDSIIHKLDEEFLERDDDGKPVEPGVYEFGKVLTPNSKGYWKIRISRNKVLRLCNQLMNLGADFNNIEVIMYILTNRSILTEKEYNIIKEAVERVMKKGVRLKW